MPSIDYPRIIKFWNVISPGGSLAGKASGFEPPEVKFEMDMRRDAGHGGKMPYNMGLDELETTFIMSDYQHGRKHLGILNSNSTTYIFHGAAGTEEDPSAHCVVLTMTGVVYVYKMDKIESGKVGDHEFKMHLKEYKMQYNGTTEVDISISKGKCIIDGIDYWAPAMACINA